MLEGLELVDWGKLEHAYGPAADVPGLLRDLAGADREARAAALEALYGNICHQGTRYPATAKALPFLVEMLQASRPADAAQLLLLLTSCTAGLLSPVTGPLNASGPLWQPAAEPKDALLEEIERAAAAALPAALKLLDCPQPRTRIAAAWFLASARPREQGLRLGEKLGARLSRENVPLARASLVFALAHVLPPGQDGLLLEVFQADTSALSRAIAAMMLARRLGPRTPPAVVDALCQLLSADGRLLAEYSAMPWQSEGLLGDVAAVIAGLGPSAVARVLPALQARLAKVKTFDAVNLLEAALLAAFGEASAPKEAAELSLAQRELLGTLVNNVAFWTVGNALNALMERKLPSGREAMAEYLGVTPRYQPVEQAKAAARMLASFGGARALAEWDKVLALAPDDAEALAAAGELLLQGGQLDKAASYLEKAVDRDPQSGRAWFHRGFALAQQERFEDALRAFTLAEELLDDPYPARQNRIGMLQRLGRAEEAAALDAEADPDAADDPAEAWYNRGLGAVKAGRYDESIAAVGKAVEQRPDHANSYYTLACAHCLRAQEGDAERAMENVQKALALEPELAADIADDSDLERIRHDPRFAKLVGR